MNCKKYNPPPQVAEILAACPELTITGHIEELIDMACGGPGSGSFEVAYEIEDKGKVVEATVARVRNGVCVNYADPYMRRRDPDCLVIADNQPTDKPSFQERYGQDFAPLRERAFAWLKSQPLAMFGFVAGQPGMGLDALAIVPANAGFFALGLALLQGILPYDEVPTNFAPKLVIYVAPTFRHTDFGGKQVVVHNRRAEVYEMFSCNLYPGPSAKKGVYGALIDLGEREKWVTAHCSVVQLVTPYDNILTLMHEGASGGGKSEMLEQAPREPDGRLLLGTNLLTGEQQHLEIPRSCALHPIADDMALCHPSVQQGDGKLCITDAEKAWFVRVDHIDRYGSDVHLERLTAQPSEPLLFLNIDAVPGSRALIWEHTEDAPGKPCPNPRVIIPRRAMSGVIDKPTTVDIRSFGVRTPPCTAREPTYGILGFFHLLPPALAWIWRLVAPRGYENPSIVATEGISSEGVGSYWPFAPGRRVVQANLLLDHFQRYTATRYILCPNQHIGAWKVGFTPQWIAREYLARRGIARFRPEQLHPARCSLLGYTVRNLQVEGRVVPDLFLRVETQPEVGQQAYDQGAQSLYDFFRQCLTQFLEPDLAPKGREIITCCMDNGTIEDYERLIPSQM
jgi:hypothetical protein